MCPTWGMRVAHLPFRSPSRLGTDPTVLGAVKKAAKLAKIAKPARLAKVEAVLWGRFYDVGVDRLFERFSEVGGVGNTTVYSVAHSGVNMDACLRAVRVYRVQKTLEYEALCRHQASTATSTWHGYVYGYGYSVGDRRRNGKPDIRLRCNCKPTNQSAYAST